MYFYTSEEREVQKYPSGAHEQQMKVMLVVSPWLVSYHPKIFS